LFGYILYSPLPVRESTFETIVWQSYNFSALNGIQPISRQEFLERQAKLSLQLAKEEVDAFIAEPGGTTQYYANFSDATWKLSERPFLLVVTPKETFFLVPLFEVSRAKLLSIPTNETNFVTWAERNSSTDCSYSRCISLQNPLRNVTGKIKNNGRRQCPVVHSSKPR
jgi:Xaa-Pro aminopeptidase